MNNKNKILVGCLALLLVLSVGYALFSDTITINGTATAKGDFAYQIECIPGVSSELSGSAIDYQRYSWFMGSAYNNVESLLQAYPEGNFSNDVCQVNGNNVSFSTEFAIPGSRRFFTVKLTNTGSIPITPEMDKIASDTNIDIIATIAEDGGKMHFTKDDLGTAPESFAYLMGYAYDVKDLASNAAQTGDLMYLLVMLAYPERISQKNYDDSDITVSVRNYGELAGARTSGLELNVGYEVTLPIKQITN